MIKKNISVIIIALLIGVSIVTSWRYLVTIQEKQKLETNLKETKDALASLDKQNKVLEEQLKTERELKEKLSAEKVAVEENLKEIEARLVKVDARLTEANIQVTALNHNIENIGKENSALREEKNKLQAEKDKLQQEKDNLEMGINNLKDEKKKLEDALSSKGGPKRTSAKLKKQAVKTDIELENKPELEKTVKGNKGFLIKQGKPTFNPKVAIKVTPAP